MRAPAIALCAALLTAGPAAAQDMKAFASIYSAEVFQQEIIAMGKPALSTGAEEAPGGPAEEPASQQALSYEPSPEVERRTREKLSESLTASTADPAAQEQIQQSVASDSVWLQFHRVLSKAGYTTTNLADVAAAYYIIVWEVVNGPEAAANAAGFQAVRADVAAAYAADPRLEELSDAEKQEAASIMAYMATMAAASANELRRNGDEAGLRKLQDTVRKAVLEQGLDVARLRLTEQGFAAR